MAVALKAVALEEGGVAVEAVQVLAAKAVGWAAAPCWVAMAADSAVAVARAAVDRVAAVAARGAVGPVVTGLVAKVLAAPGQEETGQEETGQEETCQEETCQEETGQEETGQEEMDPMRRETTDPGRTALPRVGVEIGRPVIRQAGPRAQPSRRCARDWRGDPSAVHREAQK